MIYILSKVHYNVKHKMIHFLFFYRIRKQDSHIKVQKYKSQSKKSLAPSVYSNMKYI